MVVCNLPLTAPLRSGRDNERHFQRIQLHVYFLLQNSFHGRTYGSMAVTTSKTYYRQGFAPLMPQARECIRSLA